MMKKTTLNSLAALAAAAALPVHAESAPTESAISYRFSQYQESDLPEERTFSETTERYAIDVHQVGYRRPLAGDWYLRSELQYETMSGASPIQTYQNTEGQSVVLMSGASIDESRVDFKLAPTRYFSGKVDGSLGGNLAMSFENDYQSVAVGADGTLNILDNHTTLLGSVSLSRDTLAPTDAFLSAEREAADGRMKRSFSVYQAVSQVLNQNNVVQVGAGFTRLSGYLSDPYKFEDNRPNERSQYTITAQYRRYMPVRSGAALHADYRFYSDSWGMVSNTFTARWAQKLEAGAVDFHITPMARYYRQTQAKFYSLNIAPPEGDFSSSDYRLSSYASINLGLEARAAYKRWELSFDFQQYLADEDMMILQVPESETPALVDYTVVSVGIEYKTF
jgi:hypothetical protein